MAGGLCIAITSSAIGAKTLRLWVMRTMALPDNCCSSAISSGTCPWVVAAGAVVGLSPITNAALQDRAW